MKWKNRLIHAGVLLVIFFLAIIVFGYITNKKNNNRTTDMGNATRPQISFSYNGYTINDLPAYKKSMKITAVRDTVTPVNNGQLQMNIKAYENVIQNISYKVYTLDGEQVLMEKSLADSGENAALAIDGADVLSEERVLEVILHIEGGQEMHYYTRIIDGNGLNALECLDYIHNFHENALAKAEGAGIGTAIEPNGEGDNTTLQHVTIHSDYDHVTWGDLEPQVEGNERWSIREINSTYTVAVLEYRVRGKGEENEEDRYQVREAFRVRHIANGSRTYLLDYDRTMEQLVDPAKKILSEKGVILGVTAPDLQYKINKDGTVVSFVQANELWNYNRDKDEISLVFSFADAENTDVRNLLRQHDIRILAVDSEGNTTFAVAGYMNRGSHEAETGIAIYYYNMEQNSVEEKAFVASEEGYERTQQDMGSLVYYNVKNDALYTLIGGTLYEMDMQKGHQTELTTGLGADQYVVSDDGHLIAYRLNDEAKIVVKNLSSDKEYEVTAQEGEQVLPQGFVKNDFVYGTARNEDVSQGISGTEIVPMYKVEITTDKNEVIKTYEQAGIFVLNAEVSGNMITLRRAVRDGESYTATTEDYITSNEEAEESNISVATYVTELKETQVRLAFADGISDKEPKLLKPKQVVTGDVTEVSYAHVDDSGCYYVYALGQLQEIYRDAAKAVQSADTLGGIVVDSGQSYIWVRGNRDLKYSINEEDGKVEALRAQLAAGSTPVEAFQSVYGGAAIDFTGCSASQLLYVVNQGKPVIAVLDAQTTVLIVGYGENMLTYVDVASGTRTTVAQEQMQAIGYFGIK